MDATLAANKMAQEEVCDDGNTIDGQGCAANCAGELWGYNCMNPSGGKSSCIPVCENDGASNFPITGDFDCNDGASSDPGCDNCNAEPGYVCDTSPNPGAISICVPTCGNGV